jgi:hypothetical protein
MALLDDVDRERFATPPLDRVHRALDAGDIDAARAAVVDWATRVRSLQVLSVEWITSLLSYVGRELGDDGVEAALRGFHADYLDERRAGDWAALPLRTRVGAITRAMLANGGTVEITEEADAVLLGFRCGSGGRLLDEGRYTSAGGPYLELVGPTPLTGGAQTLGVYCSHCPVHNELIPLEQGGVPTAVETPSPGPGGVCVHRVPVDPHDLPVDLRPRLGLA